jgi:magnesium chelatase family protein
VYGRVTGVSIVGVRGQPIVVEAHVGRGLPSLTLTGLPGAAVQDARDRVRPAVESCRLEWPLRRVVVNLSPGNVRKDGPGLDLAVAMAVLVATAQMPQDRLDAWAVAGELSLRGTLVATPGILSVAIAALQAGCRGVIVPAANAPEAALVDGLDVVGAQTLAEAVGFIRGAWRPAPLGDDRPPRPSTSPRSVGRRRLAGRSRSRPPVATTCA